MSKIKFVMIIVILAASMSFSSNAFGLDNYGWVSGMSAGSDNTWENPTNWWLYSIGGGHPTEAPVACNEIYTGWANYEAEIYVNSNVTFNNLYMGDSAYSDLTINAGASMEGAIQTVLGTYNAPASVTVNGSLIMVNGGNYCALLIGNNSNGVLTVNDGGIVDVKWLHVARGTGNGHLQLNGGSVHVGISALTTDPSVATFAMGGSTGIPTIDFAGGKLILDNGTKAENFWSQYFNERITENAVTVNGLTNKTLDYEYDSTNNWTIIKANLNQFQAQTPFPYDYSTSIQLDATLNWSAGLNAVSHDIYFGTSWSDVNSASNPDISPGKGRQSATSYDPATLSLGQKYYWRIDEYNGTNVTKGNIWTFTTADYTIAPDIAAPSSCFPDGNDSDNGSLDHPFKTLERAQVAVRSLISEGLSEDMYIYLHEGTYYLSQPLYFGPSDADGDSGYKIIWGNYPGETPVLSGANIASGWQNMGNDIWSVTLDDVAYGNWWFRNIWKDSIRCTRSRWPNEGQLSEVSNVSNDYKTLSSSSTIPACNNPMANDTEVVLFHKWAIAREKVTSCGTDYVTTSTAGGSIAHPELTPAAGEEYYLESHPSFIDLPGEWHLNRSDGTLQIKMEPGSSPENSEYYLPRLNRLLVVSGNEFSPVQNLIFSGLVFKHSTWQLPVDGYDAIQAGHYGQTWFSPPMFVLQPAIQFSYAQNCHFEKCLVANLGTSGIALGQGCFSNQITQCQFQDISGTPIMVGWRGDPLTGQIIGSSVLTSDWAIAYFSPNNNIVSNNLIEDFADEYYGCVGISESYSKNSKIENNTIRNGSYSGISTGFRWDYGVYSQENVLVKNNHIYNVMKILSDGGGIYTLGNHQGGLLTGNLIHDVQTGYPGSPHPEQCRGVHFDNATSNLHCENTITYNINSGVNYLEGNHPDTPANPSYGTNYWATAPGNPSYPTAIADAAGTNTSTVSPTLSWSSSCDSIAVTGSREPWATLHQAFIQETGQNVSAHINIKENGAIAGGLPRSIISSTSVTLNIVTADPDGHLSDTGYSNTIIITAGDITCDNEVNFKDMVKLASYWLMQSCGNCDWVDLNGDGNVTVEDLKVISDNWLGE